MSRIKTSGLVLCTIALISFTSCSSSSGTTTDDTTTGTVEGTGGTLTAADGSPLAGAFVGISESSSSSLIKALNTNTHGHAIRYAEIEDDEGDSCNEVDGDFLATDCSGLDGSWSIDVEVPCGTSLAMTVSTGTLSFSTTINVTCPDDSDGDGDLADEGVVDSGTTEFSNDGCEDADDCIDGTIAVTKGAYDEIENVLAKLGFGEVDEFGVLDTSLPYDFDLYDDGAETTEDLISDPDLLASYDIVFFNCGNDDESLFETYADNLAEYVENGGVIYATDWSYQSIETPFPDFMNFAEGGDDSALPESPFTAAKIGTSGITSDATVDADLGGWLDNVTVNDGTIGVDCYTSDETIVNAQEGARNEDGTVTIGDFLGGWVVMDGVHNDIAGTDAEAVIWASGPVDTFYGSADDAPLTVSRPQGDGAIVYSSYHTAHTCPTTGFWPQERILQYLVFE